MVVAAGDDPADAVAGGEGLGEGTAVEDETGVVVGLAGAGAFGAEGELAKNVVFYEGDVVLFEEGDEVLLGVVRHGSSQRVAAGGEGDAGVDGLGFQDALEDIQPQAVLGVGGDFEGAEGEGFEDVEDAEVGGGLDSNDVSGFGNGAEAEHEGLRGAAGGDDVCGGDDGTAFEHAFADLAAEELGAGREIVHDAAGSGMAGFFGEDAVEFDGGQDVRAGDGTAEGKQIGGGDGVKEAGVAVAEAAGHGDAGRAGEIEEGLGRGFDEEAGLVPGLDEARGFELDEGLDGGAHADAVLIADGAEGRGALAGPQDAIVDHFGHGVGDVFVERLRGHERRFAIVCRGLRLFLKGMEW